MSPAQDNEIKLRSASSNNTKSQGNNAKYSNKNKNNTGNGSSMIDSFQNKQKIGSPNTTINNNNIIININKSYNVKK